MNDIDILIEQILALQSTGNKYFPAGIFPAYRINKYWFYKRADCNVFYTATIVFTLNQLKEKVSEKSQKNIEEITENALKNYPNFQNKDGLKTYNFYQTSPSNHFPNGLIFKHLKHFQLPDDIDDTALIYLTKKHSEEEIFWLKNKLKKHANLATLQVKNTFPTYKNLKVYSTWFGKNMPIEFDACALCNILYFIFKNNLPLNENDYDTLKFLREVIMNDEFITNPFKVAHNYATTPLIIYHYARLLGDFQIAELEICREKLIETAKQLIDNEEIMFNKIMLETALSKLSANNYQLSIINYQLNFTPNYFFIAGLLSAYENSFLHYFADKKFTQIKWQCEAHDLTLLVENLLVGQIFNLT